MGTPESRRSETKSSQITVVRSVVCHRKDHPTMKSITWFLVQRPRLLRLAPVAIALIVAACSPGGSGGSGY